MRRTRRSQYWRPATSPLPAASTSVARRRSAAWQAAAARAVLTEAWAAPASARRRMERQAWGPAEDREASRVQEQLPGLPAAADSARRERRMELRFQAARSMECIRSFH